MVPSPPPVNNFQPQILPNSVSSESGGGLPELEKALAGPLWGMTAYHQFIIYVLKASSRPGKMDKLPCDHRTGKLVSAHDSQYWTDAATALASAARYGSDFGVGFVFTQNDPFFFLDMDGSVVPTGWSPLAHEMFALFPECAKEVSGSLTGGHIFGTGVVPPHGCRNRELGLEFYTEGRFVALTGIGAVGDCLADASAVMPAFVAKYFPGGVVDTSEVEWSTGHELGWELPDDDELIRRTLNIKSAGASFGNKASFADLWTSNVSVLSKAFPAEGRPYDASSADAALAGHLAWRTGNDCNRIAKLMMQSGLVRDKYEREDYLPRTIRRALVRDGEFWDPKYKEKKQEQIAPTVAAPATPGDAISIGSIDLKGIEASLLQQKTQDSVALVFELKQAGRLLFNHSRGQWLEWDGTRWKYEGTLKAFDFTRNLARALNFGGASSSMGSAQFCGGVEKFTRASRTFAVEGNQFDRDNYLLTTPAGTIDLRSGKMRPHDQADMITKCTNASPSTGGDGAAFRKFMMEITQGDEELIRFHQVSLGSILSGAIEDHWMLFWTGEGRNGKNTLGELVEDALGDYARKIASSVLMAKQTEGHLAELAQLQGVRIAISSEINDGDHWHESRIKELTGDTTINARFMRQDHFTFQRTQKHLIYGNHRPQLRSVDSAIRSRIKIVPFNASFLGREDKDLPRRLREEIGFVLQWLIQGHIMWLEAGRKLPACAAVEAESADYFASQSTPEMWLGERCEIVAADDRQARQLPGSGDLYRDYSDWKKGRGEQPISQTRWAQGVMRGFKKVPSTWGVRYKGLRLLPLALPFGVPEPPTREEQERLHKLL
jgi:putative DNA primase/helicase